VKARRPASVTEAPEGRLLLSCLFELLGVLPLGPVFIVFLTIFIAGEDLIGLIYFFELGLSRLIPAIYIGVKLMPNSS